MSFASLEDLVVASCEAVQPPEQLRVYEAAQKYHIIRVAGAHSGPWSMEKTPYMKEPQEVLTSLEYSGMVFAGPARTGKSVMAINWLTQTVKCDPADMLFVNMTQQSAREWSKSDLDRAIRNSPELKKRLKPGRQNDNTHDKEFIAGNRVLIKWPSVSELSGKTIPRQWLFDYDRMPDSVDGEGNAFDLAKKRGQTFGRYSMCAAESSPGRDIEDPKALPETPHAAPPVKGILGLYNRGDRRLWFWSCPECGEAFEPDFKLLKWPDTADAMEASQRAYMMCPHCGGAIEFEQREMLNRNGRWVRDGMMWLPESDQMVPVPGRKLVRSDIASFWLKGPAAAFQTWQKLVFNYLKAVETYEASNDEEALRTTTNLDQGLPYIPKSKISDRAPEALKDRAEDWGTTADTPTVPEDVRALLATVDVQKRAFVVQVHGILPHGDIAVVDSFKITKSPRREDDDGHPALIDPAAYLEDWDALIAKVIEREYLLSDGSGRKMSVMLTGCDTGGQAGVTPNALNFWRNLKADGEGHHRRFALLKGDPLKTAPSVTLRYPDANKKDRHSGARGDVPVLHLNSNLLKDRLANSLARTDVGGGMIRYPSWLPNWFYTQITAEVRNDGKWENPSGKRNECWDLLYYCIALMIRRRDTAPFPVLAVDEVNWDNPTKLPVWAQPWDKSDFVTEVDKRPVFVAKTKVGSLADMASKMA